MQLIVLGKLVSDQSAMWDSDSRAEWRTGGRFWSSGPVVPLMVPGKVPVVEEG